MRVVWYEEIWYGDVWYGEEYDLGYERVVGMKRYGKV